LAIGHEQPKGQPCSLIKNIISFIINRLEKFPLKKSKNSSQDYVDLRKLK